MAQSIKVKHNIEMAHRLHVLPGKCQNIHGHSWWCHLTIMDYTGLATPESEGGIIIDLHTVKLHFRKFLDETYDHKFALDVSDPLVKGHGVWGDFENIYPGAVLTPGPPSVENMAKWIGEWARKQFGLEYHYTVELYEAATNCATWEG